MGSSGDIFHIACYCLGNIYQFIYKRTALCCLAMYYFGDVYNAIEHRLLFLTLGGYGTKGIITEELGQCAYSIHDEQQQIDTDNTAKGIYISLENALEDSDCYYNCVEYRIRSTGIFELFAVILGNQQCKNCNQSIIEKFCIGLHAKKQKFNSHIEDNNTL